MKRTTAEVIREYGPFPGADRVHGVTYDGQHVWFASGDHSTPSILRAEKRSARLRSPRMPGRRSTVGICFRSPRIASRRSIRKPAVCFPASRRRPAAIPGLHGLRERSGLADIAIERFINSIPKRGRFFAPLSPIASSPALPGPTESYGTAPGKMTRAS